MLKLSLSHRAAVAAAFVAAVARVFLALAVELGSPHNGAWLSALVGALPATLWVLCLWTIGENISPARRTFLAPLTVLLLVASLIDGGIVLASLGRSAGYLALDRVPTVALTLPVCLALLWCASRNGDAVGYSAMVWARLFPALLALVALLQARHYRPEWLRPLLGEGGRSIARAGIGAAGWMVPPSAILLVSEPESEEPKRSIRLSLYPIAAAIIAALLLALSGMMTPTLLYGNTWLNRLDALLTNGRAPLYLQLPMIVLWYGGLFHLLLCEGFSAAALLQRLIPQLDGRVCVALAVLSLGLLSTSGLASLFQRFDGAQWLFIGTALLTSLSAMLVCRKRGDARQCPP